MPSLIETYSSQFSIQRAPHHQAVSHSLTSHAEGKRLVSCSNFLTNLNCKQRAGMGRRLVKKTLWHPLPNLLLRLWRKGLLHIAPRRIRPLHPDKSLLSADAVDRLQKAG